MTRDWLIERFTSIRAGALPALRVPALRGRGDHALNPGLRPIEDLTPAAVLVGIVDRSEGMTVILTRRTDHLARHAGQISFPGGHIEPADGSPETAALRETEEEIGLARRHVTVLGRLDTYSTRTGFDITPVVGVVECPFTLAPDAREVAEVFEVPLRFLLNPVNHHRHSRLVAGRKRHYFAMPYGEYYIWGATAGMLVNLYEYLGQP